MPDNHGGIGDFQALIASAGTGKTYDLVERIRSALEGGLEPHRLLATTFTVRAAAELAGRIRSRLTERGRPDLAAALLSARINTVNGVSGALVGEFALEAGRSPGAEVIAEDRVRAVFSLATGAVLGAHAPRIREFAERLEIPERSWARQDGGATVGWVETIHAIVDQARANGVTADDLPRSAAHSRAGLLALLGEGGGDGAGGGAGGGDGAGGGEAAAVADAIDVELSDAIRAVHDALTRNPPKTGTSRKFLAVVSDALDELATNRVVAWPTWVRLVNTEVAKDERSLVAHLKATAGKHAQHPRLRSDLAGYLDAIFAAAADALRAFDRFKAERGWVDFVDQETLALAILRDERLRERLTESIGAVFVDESQDSSPIQLAIFAALATLAPVNVWVGDPKQSIYAFRSADPELTEHAARQMARAARRTPEYLGRSYRSRPEICAFVNAAFVPAFTALGLEPKAVAFASWERRAREGAPPAFGILRDPAAKKAADEAAAIARGIAEMLADPHAWPVEERSGAVRPLRGGDVAVLCRTNATVGQVTSALERTGIRAQAELPGLMALPECELLHAALRRVADPTDTLAAAEIARFVAGPSDWLQAAFAEGDAERWNASIPFADALDALRARAMEATPTEVLDEILHLGVLDVIDGWGDAVARREHLEALRALARAYQEEERASGRAVTIAGLVEHLSQVDASSPASQHQDAVHVLTYHAAKGLEWPAVILTDLHQAPKGRVFGIAAEALTPTDWRDPLRDRVIRYWPWPYGASRKDIPLAEAAAASETGRAALKLERAESLRLLYVGVTRARDYLIFAPDRKGTLSALGEIRDANGDAVITIGDDAVHVAGVRYPTRLLAHDTTPAKPGTSTPADPGAAISADPGAAAAKPASALIYRAARATRIPHPPRAVRPSDVRSARAPLIFETIALGPALALPDRFDMRALGDALHGFFAVDDPAAPEGERRAAAEAMLTRWRVAAFGTETALTASQRLQRFLAERYPNGDPRHEWPIHAEERGRVTTGRTDLVIDLPDGFVLIDHKSFPGDIAGHDERLRAFAGQTTLYARALTTALAKPCLAVWAHQPVAGRITRLEVMGDEG